MKRGKVKEVRTKYYVVAAAVVDINIIHCNEIFQGGQSHRMFLSILSFALISLFTLTYIQTSLLCDSNTTYKFTFMFTLTYNQIHSFVLRPRCEFLTN